MKILLLNDDALPVAHGGAAVVVENLRSAYTKAGHTVTLITTHQDKEKLPIERWKDEHGTVISIKRIYDLRWRHRLCLHDAKMNSVLEELFQEIKPDVIHAHNLHTYLTYDALRVARSHTEKIFLTAHDVFLVAFKRVNSPRYFESVIEKKPYKMHFWEHLSGTGRKYWPLRNGKIKQILRETGVKVIAVSDALKNFLEANDVPVNAVVHNGTPPAPEVPENEIETFRSRMHLTGPTIFFGGRLSEDKGITPLLRAFKKVLERIPSAKLLIAGDSDRVKSVINACPRQVTAAIRSTGWLGPDQLPLAYAASSLVTTPSLCLDTFNLMNAEAMMAGKPVVGTIFGGTPEIIEHGKTGFVCDPRNIERYAGYLLELLENPKKAKQMGEAGRNRAQEKFTSRLQAEKYLEIF